MLKSKCRYCNIDIISNNNMTVCHNCSINRKTKKEQAWNSLLWFLKQRELIKNDNDLELSKTVFQLTLNILE